MSDYPYPIDPVPAGPVEKSPRGFRDDDDSRTALLAELEAAGVELGEYDRRIVDWLAGWEWSTVATIASWVKRAGQEQGK
ncbi:hypothetical protein ACGF3J_38585 [Streptomyces sp. NPDC048171]|uniref:hypothetical protein n=1 Tax=Streptomyces sp. NPDC048171 TaxID=3365504 RepID=UPI00371D3393